MSSGWELTRRQVLRGGAVFGVGAAATLLGGAPAHGQAGKKLAGPVNFLGWGGHKEDAQAKDFAERTGAKLNFTGFAENADALTKVKLEGGSRWDLVAIDALWVPKFNELKLLEPIDLKSWPIHKDLFDEFKDLPPWRVGNMTSGVPWSWSPMYIWYNPKHVTDNPTSWEVLWDPKYRKRFAGERQPVDMIAYAAVANGARDPYNLTKDQIKSAKDALIRLKPNILTYIDETVDLVKAFTDESIWLTIANVGMGHRVKAAGGPELKSFLPKEGYVGYYDGDCLVKGAAHKDAAISWLQDKCQAKWLAMNFMRMYRPLAFKSGYDALVKDGKKELADSLAYNKPELALKMVLKGAPPNIGDYVDAFNEAMAG
jgi:spermidine/putrescine-binding protein